MRHVLLLLAAALLASASPAAAQQSPSDDPTLGSAFDSAAVVSALAALPAPAGPAPLVELRFDSLGAFVGAEGVGASVPTEYVRAVTEVVRGHSRALPRRAGGYGILATVAGGASPTFATKATVQKAPSLVRDPAMRRMLRELSAAAREEANWEAGIAPGMSEASAAPRSSGRFVVELRLRVLADGTVGAVWLHRGSRRPRADAQAVRSARGLRFEPATVDGRAVPVFVLLPINVTY